MHKNMNFNIEQTRLNNTYQRLNSNHDFHRYLNNQKDPLHLSEKKQIVFVWFLWYAVILNKQR